MISKDRQRRLLKRTNARIQLWKYRRSGLSEQETGCRFIGSQGLRKICDYWDRDGRPPSPKQIGELHASCASPVIIHIEPEFLPAFERDDLKRIEQDFILVTGCSDLGIDQRAIGEDWCQQLLDYPRLTAWFAQNCDADHPKLKRLPIGLDYHTLAGTVKHWPWGYFMTPLAQEASLNDARLGAPKLFEKELPGYCNWHHSLDRGDRLNCINSVAYDTIHLEDLNIERDMSWRNNARHFFTISPLGAGLDCHRTWEAILLGSVPIVKRTGISSLFSSLPVCVVDDWSEVTASYLKHKREWILQSEFDFAQLYLDWWRLRFRGETKLPKKISTFQAFIDTASQPLQGNEPRMVRAA